MRTNRRPGPVNADWGDKVGICKLRHRAEPVNTNLVPGPVSTNWGPGPGAGKYKHPILYKFYINNKKIFLERL